MSLVDFPVDIALDRTVGLRTLLTDELTPLLLANVVQTVAVYGGLA